ncbi:MAG: lysophospholipid acyltransferase family protein [Syntrophales bacterium]|nr:lysophospholipid acyltransferase family protein [Syntrophales bacterium]
MIIRLSKFAIKHGLIPLLSKLVHFYVRLLRLQSENEDMFYNHLNGGTKAVVALWHQRILAVLPHAMRYGTYSPAVMISKSRDGDMIADVYERLKFHAVRGSSSRGGKEGLRAMVEYLKSHLLAVHIIDGPQGPAGVIKPGLIILAQHTHSPIIPIYVSVSKAWILKSWDRFLIPKPFSKVYLRFDKPIEIPQNLTPDEFETLRKHIESQILYNQRFDDERFGFKNLI